jgi:hypothetical protein
MNLKPFGIVLLSCLALFVSCKANPCVSQQQLEREDLMRKAVQSKTVDLALPTNIQATITDVISMPDLQYGTAKLELRAKSGVCGAIYVTVICSGTCDTVFAKAVLNPNAAEDCYK